MALSLSCFAKSLLTSHSFKRKKEDETQKASHSRLARHSKRCDWTITSPIKAFYINSWHQCPSWHVRQLRCRHCEWKPPTDGPHRSSLTLWALHCCRSLENKAQWFEWETSRVSICGRRVLGKKQKFPVLRWKNGRRQGNGKTYSVAPKTGTEFQCSNVVVLGNHLQTSY